MASKLRDEGNIKFQHGNTGESLKLYSQSIICSPEVGPELSLAFGNRSAALYRLDQFQASLTDIILALKYKFPKNLEYKIQQRKGQCHTKLGEHSEAREAFLKAMEMLDLAPKLTREKKESLLRDIQSLMAESERLSQSENPQPLPRDVPPNLDENLDLPGAATFLTLKSEPGARGRHVTTEKDITAGEVLFSETPFASVQIPEHSSTHCHHCYIRFLVSSKNVCVCVGSFVLF